MFANLPVLLSVCSLRTRTRAEEVSQATGDANEASSRDPSDCSVSFWNFRFV